LTEYSKRLYHIPDNHVLDLLDEYELEKGEDVPMSVDADIEVSKVSVDDR
jgi:hypothetical protein